MSEATACYERARRLLGYLPHAEQAAWQVLLDHAEAWSRFNLGQYGSARRLCQTASSTGYSMVMLEPVQ